MTFSTTFQATFRVGVDEPKVSGTLLLGRGIRADSFRMSLPVEGVLVEESQAQEDGTYTIVQTITDGYMNGVYFSHSPIADYYYQIWVLPALISVNNPQFNSGIPFTVWNAYPYDNQIQSITEVGDPGTTISLSTGDVLSVVEFHATSISVLDDAPTSGLVSYTFDFVFGSGVFTFSYQIISYIAEVLPEVPTTEKWEWKTDIITSQNSHVEQRIANRLSPRITYSFRMLVLNELDRRKNFQRMFSEIQTTKLLPFFQYAAPLTQEAIKTATRIYFEPARCDCRVGDYVFIYSNDQRQYRSHLVTALYADGADVSPALSRNFKAGSFVVAAHECLIQDGSGLSMKNTNGDITYSGIRRYPREDFVRPDTDAVLRYHQGYPVLYNRPTLDGSVDERFSMESSLIDYETGVFDVVRNRTYPFITGGAYYKIPRFQDPNSMDYWRLFFDTIKGRRGAFYFPTWRRDFVLTEDIGNNTNVIYTENNGWKDYYEGKVEFGSIQFVAADGDTIFRKIVSVVETGTGYTVTLDTNIPDVDKWKTKNIIVSYLLLVRMTEDSVELTHQHRDSYLKIGVRTVQA